MEGIDVNVDSPDQFFSIAQETLPWQPILGKIGEMTLIQHPAFENGLEYRNMDKQLYSANDPSTWCRNMVNFGPVTPEIEVWQICTLETIRQNSA